MRVLDVMRLFQYVFMCNILIFQMYLIYNVLHNTYKLVNKILL